MTAKKINLSPDQLAIVDRYCSNDLRELKKICLPLISMKGVADMEIDDLLMSCWRSGKYQDLVEDREEMDWLNKKIEEYVIDRTNLTKDDIKEIREKKKDFYIHSDEAVKYGIVDEVL